MDFNPLIASAYSEEVRRVFGEDIQLSSVSPELGLGVILDVDPTEWAFLRGKRWWLTRASVNAGGAGFRSQVQVFNPAGSGILSVVKGFIPQPQAGGTFETDLLHKSVTALVTLNGRVFLTDLRPGISAQGSGVTQLRTQNTAAIGTVDTIAALVLDRSLPIFPLEVTLAPGSGLILSALNDNIGVAGGFFGYERLIKPEELAVGT